jgi:uncharacterized integral membrane protein
VGQGRRRTGSLGFVVGVVVAIPATIFALSNLEPATVEFVGWQAEVPLWAVIGISVLAGVLIGSALTAAFGARRRREKKRKAQARVTAAAQDDEDAITAGTALDGPGGLPPELTSGRDGDQRAGLRPTGEDDASPSSRA